MKVSYICARFSLALLFLVGFQSVNAQPTVSAQCGDIIEGEFTEDFQPHFYSLQMQPGDSIQVSAEPLGDILRLSLVVLAPNGAVIGLGGSEVLENILVVRPGRTPAIQTGVFSARGNYTIIAYNGPFDGENRDPFETHDSSNGGPGVYTLYIGCTLRDGTVIEPGDIIEENEEETDSEDTGNNLLDIVLSEAERQAAASEFGFPGLAPRDFSAGIEIPLTLGQPQTAPIANDVALYTYDASAGEVATLNISRASGDLSIGVTVINQDTNAIVFLGGMPFSESLTATLNFPSDGTYAIGLFRLDTAERTGTSGAVQLVIE